MSSCRTPVRPRTSGWSTGFWPTPVLASGRRGRGSIWPVTPTRPGTPRIPLRTIWLYRDWVIDALNADMPFDQFTIEQIAGDLLPKPTTEELIATAFNRNTMTNTEGGTDDEEFRVAAIKDRVDTTMDVWMGLTIGCAKCHSHKFDPITQKEYYQFFALFNQTADNDQPNESPTLSSSIADERSTSGGDQRTHRRAQKTAGRGQGQEKA